MSSVNRRQFLKSGMATAAAAGAGVAATPERPAGFRPPSQAGRGLKFGCSTALWTKGGRASLAEALAGISAAGYEWVEADANELWDYRERPEDFKKLLEKHGLGLVAVSLAGNFADRDERLKNINRAVLVARALQALEAGILVLESTGWGKIPRQPRNYHIFSSNLGEIGALVYEETGLHCAYRFNEQEAADVRKVIATSDSRYVKFCFDTQLLARLGIDAVPMIRAYGQRVIHVHLHDGLAKGGQWRDVPVGKGSVNVSAAIEALCETRYNGWANVQQETASPRADAGESLKRVRTWLQAAERKPQNAVSAEAGQREAPPDAAEAAHHGHARRGALQDLVVIGAAITAQPWSLLRPASFQSTDKSNPTQGLTQAMHGRHGRPVAPLPPQDPFFKPLFFTEEEYRDVSALVDAIIPATNTPGALEARADEYADLMIWLEQEQHDTARRQTAGFRQVCAGRYGKPFAKLSAAQIHEFLTAITGKSLPEADRPAAQFFNRIRGLAIRAYYASPQGLLQELGYKGNTYLTEFKGCTHPEHKA